MTNPDSINWGILSTANIGRSAFLPALRAAGGGMAYAVAGRDAERTRKFAADNGIANPWVGYESVIESDDIDAVYIPLPNSMHAKWTIAAIRSGKAVLCEKPLTDSLSETQRVLGEAHEAAGLLWEAFVFPFGEQMRRVQDLIAAGEIGEVAEVQSTFHFAIGNRHNIRLSPELGGGALLDVGCYCVSFARLVFAADIAGGMAVATWAPEGVDEEMDGVLSFSSERRLLFSCGMRRQGNTFTRILGTEGEIRLTNPFHPHPNDTVELRPVVGEVSQHGAANEEPSFTPAIRHIHRVLRGEESPRHLATQDALGNAVAMDLLARSARSGRYERV